MDPSLNKFRNDFIEEANGLLDHLEQDLLKLEKNPSDNSLVESIFRAMHTIKGASGMFSFDMITDFTHQLENIYQLIRDRKRQFDRSIFELTFQSIDHIRKLLIDDQIKDSGLRNNHDSLMTHMGNLVDNASVQSNNPPGVETENGNYNTWHIILYATESILMRGIKLFNIIRELAATAQYQINRIDNANEESDDWSILIYTNLTEQEIRNIFLFIEDDCTIVKISHQNLLENKYVCSAEAPDKITILDFVEGKNKTPLKNEQRNQPGENTSPVEKQVIKRISVDAVKLDQLMFLVSELITVNSQINLSSQGTQNIAIKPYLEKIDALSKQFRNNVLEIRLVPLNDTVLRFQRLIRDLSKMLAKQISFVTLGTNTELDKTTLDLLNEPLMHLIRNCIDHGIEPPDARAKQGKPETGTITMEAYNSGNHVFIKISDDGCGIDDEKVRLKAVDKGYLKPSDKPDKKTLYDFIFMPGFSTAQNLTEVSGRGVGMDVVKQSISELRGEIFVDSERNHGTTFTLKLQQSMSIVDSLLFRVDHSFFTVPITDIAVCEQLSSNFISNRKHTSTIPFKNQLIPYINLRSLFSIGSNYPEQLKSIVIKNNDKEMALLCDVIIGEHQAVLKPLGKSFRNQEFITAASQMGDGHMAFMLDTNALFKQTEV